MSTALAIAATTAALRCQLTNHAAQHGWESSAGQVTFSALPPDRVAAVDATPVNRLNLFLHRVTPNLGWANAGLPERDGNGVLVNNAPLALDLHYLLTAYGAGELQAEVLLGHAMQAFHERPVLTRDDIRLALRTQPAPQLPILRTAELADQLEQLKITPQTLSTEEWSKLWTAFQTHYRPSVAYQVSVVLIESRRPTRPTLPVREPRILVTELRRPVIEAVSPQLVETEGMLTLDGFNLRADRAQVRFGTLSVDPETLEERRLTVRVPANLSAGIRTVQVVHPIFFGQPSDPHQGFESNAVAFMLVPRITTAGPFQVSPGGTLTLPVAPRVGRSQRVELLIGDRTIALPPRPESEPETTTTLAIPIPANFPAGPHLLVRVRVDGAESRLGLDDHGHYASPEVSIA